LSRERRLSGHEILPSGLRVRNMTADIERYRANLRDELNGAAHGSHHDCDRPLQETNTTAMRLYDKVAERSGFVVYRKLF
jgi:hypothetical protein